MTPGYTTRGAAEEYDGELVGQTHRAIHVYRNTGDVQSVDLGGLHLRRTEDGNWRVYTPQDFETTDDLELVDEFDPHRFPSAKAIHDYVDGLDAGNGETDGPVMDRPGVH